MFRNKKNGFTLLELLAVIVILAMILVIAVPQIMLVSDMTYANGWLYNQEETELWPWTISPDATSDGAIGVWAADGGNASSVYAAFQSSVFPSVYLKSDIEIIGGDGDIEPYKLSV